MNKPQIDKLPHFDVTAGLILNGDKILITQRLTADKFGDFWEFPGGKLKTGETLQECLAREISEELNINISVQRHLISLDHSYPNFKITLHVFLCQYVNGVPLCRGVQNWKWVEPEELSQFQFTEADREVIQKLALANRDTQFQLKL